jgi:hypothetical protein
MDLVNCGGAVNVNSGMRGDTLLFKEVEELKQLGTVIVLRWDESWLRQYCFCAPTASCFCSPISGFWLAVANIGLVGE